MVTITNIIKHQEEQEVEEEKEEECYPEYSQVLTAGRRSGE